MKIIRNGEEYEVEILFTINKDHTVDVVWPMIIEDFFNGEAVFIKKTNYICLNDSNILVKMNTTDNNYYLLSIASPETIKIRDKINEYLEDYRSM